MRATVIRHGKVDFQWKKWSTSEQFNRDCKMYDESPIFPLKTDTPIINNQNIYISSLQRSKDTANQLFGEQDFISTGLLDEVPLCASVFSNKKLPLLFWDVSARLQWFFNIREDCIIVTHGFFMHTLLSQMKKQAFKISHTRLSYANGECVIAER